MLLYVAFVRFYLAALRKRVLSGVSLGRMLKLRLRDLLIVDLCDEAGACNGALRVTRYNPRLETCNRTVLHLIGVHTEFIV